MGIQSVVNNRALITVLMTAYMLGAALVHGQPGEPGSAQLEQEANTGFNTLFKTAEQQLMSAGPRLNEVRGEIIEDLVAFSGKYQGTVAAAVAMQNAGNLAEVLGQFDRAETLYQRGLTHRPPQEVYSELAYAAANVVARPGREIRDFTSTTLTGEAVSPESLKGKVYLLDFWATWCGPCIAELPHLRRAYKVWNDQGFEIVSISIDSNKEDLEGFLKKNDMPWQHVFDEDRPADQRLGDRFNVYGIPHTILVGRDGKIIGGGYRGQALDAAVEKALGGE